MLQSKLGILGAGQLGRMLAQEASTLDIDLHFLDKGKDYPAAKLSQNITIGDFTNYEDVLNFGKEMDIISIEIENVNTDALDQLEAMGKKVYPQSSVIKTIKDKGLQKEFYKTNALPTSAFFLVKNAEEIKAALADARLDYPFVQKSRLAGYDGKGVAVILNDADLSKLMDTPSVIEKLVDIRKELAVIVARNSKGQITVFNPVEMVFNEKGNLLDYLLSPADIDTDIADRCKELSVQTAEKLNITGILAVELFLNNNGDILINEVAPRTHNSGHHTIDAQSISQFDLHLRTILSLPVPGKIDTRPAMMINLLGELDAMGSPCYSGIEEVLQMENVFIHIYGKTAVKPLRKMGHITILFDNIDEAREKANFIKSNLKVQSWENLM